MYFFFLKDQRELCYCFWHKILILNQIKRKNIQILVQLWDSEVFSESGQVKFWALYLDHLRWHIHPLTPTHNCNMWQKPWKKRWDGMMVWSEIIKIPLIHRDVHESYVKKGIYLFFPLNFRPKISTMTSEKVKENYFEDVIMIWST